MKAATQAQQRQRLLRRSLIHFQNLCVHPYSGHNFFYTRSWASINDELECRGSAVCVLPSYEDVVRHADAHKLVEWQKCSPGVGGTLPLMTNRKLVMLSNNTNSTLQVWVRADHSGYRKLFINAAKKQFEFGRHAHDDAANYCRTTAALPTMRSLVSGSMDLTRFKTHISAFCHQFPAARKTLHLASGRRVC